MKRRIRQNIYGNWNGYEGRRVVQFFGSDEWAAKYWMEHGEVPRFDQSDFKRQFVCVERKENPVMSSQDSRSFFENMYAREESERRIKEASDPDYEVKRQGRNAETMKKLRAQRPWESSDLSREEYAMRLNAMFDKFSGKNNERKENPMKNPMINTIADFRKALEDGPYAWPGGYPMFFYTSDGEALSYEAASAERVAIEDAIQSRSNDGWRVVGVDVNWEDTDLYCVHTGKKIESAYGENPRRDNPMVGRAFGAEIWVYPSADVRRGETPKKWYAELMSDGKVWMSAEGRTQEEATQAIKAKIADAKRGERESDREQTAAMYMRHRNPTQTDVENWTERYRASVQKRVDGVPSQAQYVVKIVTTKGEAAFLRVGKGTKFDTDANSARVYRSGEKANEAATKVSNWLKKKNPAKWKAIKSISAEPKK